MFSKLTEEQQTDLLENAIFEFGEKGLEGTTISDVAKRTGVSVGVIYKYYNNKDDLFRACLMRSLTILKTVISEAAAGQDTLLGAAEQLIRISQQFAKEHPSYFRMYHMITTCADTRGAAEYAEEIEQVTATAYTELISKAKAEGIVSDELDPHAFAFFFDDLLMILHFSYACDYYRHRMEIYCGKQDEKEYDEQIVRQLLLFIRNAFKIREK